MLKLLKKYTPEFSVMYKHFVYSDGGRWASGVSATKGKNKIGDCGVRTLVHATGADYADVWYVAKRFGWRKFGGWNIHPMKSFYEERTFFGHEATIINTWGKGKTTTIKSFIDAHPVGTYVLMTTDFNLWGHVFCIRDGKIYDTFLEDGWVYNAYEITKTTS